ncbi:MAG TPA: ABC transporter substrate-binding protein, partial [Herpetosiphonaceae bacterium]|nr:ABC transporter substrate-binding protein [Herpetosiphonaceae bacterium]
TTEAAAAAGAGGEFQGAWPYQLPPKGHYNTFATDAILGGSMYHDMLEMPMALYKWEQDEYIPMLATEWEIVEPDSFNVTLRDGVKWSDGTDFTTKDVVATFNLLRAQSSVVWKYLESVTEEGENTVVFKMKEPSTVVERYVLRERIRPSSVYGEWATKAQDLFATGGEPDAEALKQLRTQFEEFRPEQMVVTGPFQIDQGSVTEAQLTLVKNPTAWNAGNVAFDRIVLYNGETPTVTPLVLGKEVDFATHGFPPATEKAFEQQGIRVLRPPVYNGPALYINYAKVKALQDPKVRQAIAMAINKDENAAVSLGDSAKKPEYMAGVADSILERWLTQDELGKLNKYEYNVEEAAKMLEGLGFKKEGDVWVSPEGERMEYELGFPAEFADWSAAGQNLATQLTNFGIKITPRPVTFTQWTPDVTNGRFTLGIQAWGAGNPHPHFSYSQDVLRFNPPQSSGPGMAYDLKQTTEALGEVDLSALTVEAAAGLDEEKQKAAVAKLAVAFNELLPIIPLWERYGNMPALEDVRVTGWPAEGDPIYNNSPYADSFVAIMILDGTLKPAEQ